MACPLRPRDSGGQDHRGDRCRKIDLIIEKGMDKRVETYSAFTDSFGNITAGGWRCQSWSCRHSARREHHRCVCGWARRRLLRQAHSPRCCKSKLKTYVIEEAQESVDPSTCSDSTAELEAGGVGMINIDGPQVAKIRL